jgi:DNA mismatch repair protein MutS
MAQENAGAQKPHTTKETALTPLMQQYHDIKAQNPGMILFFRLGDFYEMFGDDAQKASKILEVVLTKRGGVPMCGIPFHAVNAYLKKLVKAGERVAVCEQLEEPGQGKGIVKRGIVRVVTPGTILEENLLETKRNNYLAALYPSENRETFGIAYVDISTGEFKASEIDGKTVAHELFRIAPGEILVPESLRKDPFFTALEKQSGIACAAVEDWVFAPAEAEARIRQTFRLQSLKPFSLDTRPYAAGACGAVLSYIEKTQVQQMPPLSAISYYSLENFLLLDETAIRNLEIIEGLTSNSRENSLVE